MGRGHDPKWLWNNCPYMSSKTRDPTNVMKQTKRPTNNGERTQILGSSALVRLVVKGDPTGDAQRTLSGFWYSAAPITFLHRTQRF